MTSSFFQSVKGSAQAACEVKQTQNGMEAQLYMYTNYK